MFLYAYIFDVGCVFYRVFNFACPSCGLTRAWISFFSLDFKMAFYYHPLFWTVPLFIYFFLNEGKKRNKLNKIVYILLFLYLFVYIIRIMPDIL
ncbi:MAG: DUF2752 domain-containing protein [Anaerorhabdus sp.]